MSTCRALITASLLGALALAFAAGAQAQQNLNVSKSFVPATIAPGSTSVLTFTIGTQDDTYAYSKIGFTDDLPLGVTLTDPVVIAKNSCYFTVTASNGGQTITAANGTLSQYVSSCVLAIAVTSAAPGTYTNTTSSLSWTSGGDFTSPAATAKLTVDSSLPTFSKSFSPATIYEETGTPSTLTFTIDNSAVASDATSLAFTDTLPLGLQVANPTGASSTCGGTFAPSSGDTSLTFSGGSVAAGGTCAVQVNVTTVYSDITGMFDNISADLSSSLGDSGAAAAELRVAWLEIHKTFLTSPVAPGGNSTLEFTITNHDLYSSAEYVGFTDDLNAALSGMTATALPATGFCGSGSTINGTSTLTMNDNGTVGADSSCTFDVTVQIPGNAAPGTYTNITSAVSSVIGGEVYEPSGAPASANLVVIAPVTAIPTLNVWALIALAGLLLFSAGWLLRR